MSRKDPETVEPWRSALREGDPALGAPDLDPQDVARIRRAMLATAQETAEKPRLLAWLSPAWGGAVAAVAGLLLVLGLWWLPDREEEPAPERVAVQAPAPQASPALPPAPVPPAVETTAPEGAALPVHVPSRPTAPVPPPDLPVPEPEVEMAFVEDAEPAELDWIEIPEEPAVAAGEDMPRQVQFATPGGTRVIWVLGSEDDATQEAALLGLEEKTE